MGSCHISLKKHKIKPELYNHYLHHFTVAAKLRDCFYFFYTSTQSGHAA